MSDYSKQDVRERFFGPCKFQPEEKLPISNRLAVGRDQYSEFRPDGWPLCPVCGEDELQNPWLWISLDRDRPTAEEYIAAGLSCLACGWVSVETMSLRFQHVIERRKR